MACRIRRSKSVSSTASPGITRPASSSGSFRCRLNGGLTDLRTSLVSMALSKEEREQFLSEPHIAALSVGAGDKRGPLTVPIWYQYTPGGEPWVHTGNGSRKHRLIEAQGEFTLMAQRLEPTVRYVAVDGPV